MKNNKYDCYIGVDVSKKKLDFSQGGDKVFQVENNVLGYKEFLKQLPMGKHVLVVMEASGGYERNVALPRKASSIKTPTAGEGADRGGIKNLCSTQDEAVFKKTSGTLPTYTLKMTGPWHWPPSAQNLLSLLDFFL